MNRQEQDIMIEQALKTLGDAESNLHSTSAKRNQSDFFVQTLQTVESAGGFYNQNAAALNAASDALADLSQGEILKKTSGDFLVVAKKVMDALDVVKQVHPFVGVAVVAFMAVVKLELKRRENDRRVGSMFAQASDMMGMLLQLKDIKDPNIMGHHGETIEGRLQDVVKHIAQDIEDCGNAIDKYWKSKFIVKFFRSDHWANEFLNICKSFSERKDELRLALNIRTALRVDIAIDKLEQLIKTQSERELRFEREVKLRGGKEKCLESPDVLVKLLDTSEQLETRPQNRSQIEPLPRDDNKPISKTADVALLLHELRAPLNSLLEENRAYFRLTLDKQTSRITDTINASEERIIRTININNIFQQVNDPDLQYIWKHMKWRTNVKTHYFIAELHDYYANRFSRIHHDDPRAQAASGVSSLIPLAAVQSQGYVSYSGLEEDRELPPIKPADKWCLKYLTVLYAASLAESFDSDTNRLVSIREVNAFTSARPSDWTLLQALAYWAAGWRVDSQYYQAQIEVVMEGMVDAQRDALPENRLCIAEYLNSSITGIRKLVRSLAKLDSEVSDSDLAQLAERRRKVQEEDLAHKLDGVKYEIDSPDSIQLFGSGRIENFLLPLLYLVVKRHLQIMKLAGTVILVERELQSAVQSIQNIFEGVDLRVEQLSVTFRQQGADPKARFALYAHGLYNIWYSPDLIPGDTEYYWASNNVGSDDTELEINTNALRFGPFSLPEAGGQLEGPVQLAPLGSSEEPQGVKEEYMRLWCLNELHDQRWLIPVDDVPPYISPEENQRFDTLSKMLPPEDVQCWSSLAELHLRKRLIRCYCDACHSHIIDVHHRCIDCENENYDLCVDCEPLPASEHKHQSNHKLSHNMLVVRISRPVVSYQRAMWIANKFLSALLPVADPPEGSPTECDDESTTQSVTPPDAGTSDVNGNAYPCSECGVGLVGIFYVCVVCGVHGDSIVMCRECAFRDAFNVVKEHDYKHYLVKIKDRVQDADATSEELVDAKKMEEASSFAALSSRVDNLAAIVESRFAELDRRLGELMEKVHIIEAYMIGRSA